MPDPVSDTRRAIKVAILNASAQLALGRVLNVSDVRMGARGVIGMRRILSPGPRSSLMKIPGLDVYVRPDRYHEILYILR